VHDRIEVSTGKEAIDFNERLLDRGRLCNVHDYVLHIDASAEPQVVRLLAYRGKYPVTSSSAPHNHFVANPSGGTCYQNGPQLSILEISVCV
jgi:hypothetical protein